ncbi:MAG: putative lipid II flippase FtsW [Blastocatellia bacterium]|nr:putative lipid II flippase FtsW [Blastocatellia bacterium]
MKSQLLKTEPIKTELPGIGDRWMLSIVAGLVLFGVVMVYSASAVLAQTNFHSQFYFLWRQGFAMVIGMVLLAGVLRLGYARLNNPYAVYGLLGVCGLLLTVVLFLPATRNTHRFIRLAGLSFQPSELAKIGLVVFLAYLLSRRNNEERRSFWLTFVPCSAVAALLMVLVMRGQDLGTVFIMAVVTATLYFAAGVPLRYPLAGALAASPIVIYELFKVSYRLKRLIAFLDPWKYARTEGFQVVQGLIAIGAGGVKGVGLAQGKQKLFYLPEAHTDFIFAVIGEELGLIGAATVILLFVMLGWRGFLAARKAPDQFGSLLALGLTVMLVAQALFNISVVLSILPNKGIPLPFISYGGSSLMLSLLAVGLILSVSQETKA